MKISVPPRIVALGLGAALSTAAATIAFFEGRSLVAYLDPVGIPTICDGVTRGVRLGQTKTHAQCDAALVEEVRRHAAVVDKYVRVQVSPNTYASLVSFVYNVGEGNFARSNLLRRLNRGDVRGACDEMLRWVYAGGKKLRGLERRREAERALCLS